MAASIGTVAFLDIYAFLFLVSDWTGQPAVFSRVGSFVHVPLQAGFHRVSVTAEAVAKPPGPAGSGEAVHDLAGRPSDSKLVHVVDRELRVLYVEGKFRYEAKYIAQALVAARRFTLDRRVLIQGAGENAPARSARTSTIGWPTTPSSSATWRPPSSPPSNWRSCATWSASTARGFA